MVSHSHVCWTVHAVQVNYACKSYGYNYPESIPDSYVMQPEYPHLPNFKVD